MPWNAGEKLIVSVRVVRKTFEDVLAVELLASGQGLPCFAQYNESGQAAEHEQVVANEAAAAEKAEDAGGGEGGGGGGAAAVEKLWRRSCG